MLSQQGKGVWLPRVEQDLRLKLLAVVRESAERRTEPYRDALRVPTWWTGVWEARWRPA